MRHERHLFGPLPCGRAKVDPDAGQGIVVVDKHVPGFALLRIVGIQHAHASLSEQPKDEGQVGLVVLDNVVAKFAEVSAGAPRGVPSTAMRYENVFGDVRQDFEHRAVGEDAATGAVAQQRKRWLHHHPAEQLLVPRRHILRARDDPAQCSTANAWSVELEDGLSPNKATDIEVEVIADQLKRGFVGMVDALDHLETSHRGVPRPFGTPQRQVNAYRFEGHAHTVPPCMSTSAAVAPIPTPKTQPTVTATATDAAPQEGGALEERAGPTHSMGGHGRARTYIRCRLIDRPPSPVARARRERPLAAPSGPSRASEAAQPWASESEC